MHIVSDSGMDLSPRQMDGLVIHQVPLVIQLDGKTYRSGVDVTPAEFYQLLGTARGMPSTSLPSPGEYAALYRQLAASDPDILSIHISSGLSGTLGSAEAGAAMVPEARVTVVDTMTLSAAEGWQVEAAARAARAGWPRDKILELVKRVQAATELVFTLPDLKYLRHGGRISHIKGLLATVLNIKPLIGVSKEDGRYVQRSQQRTFKRALEGMVDEIARFHPTGSALRVQIGHADNPEGAARLRELIGARFTCQWEADYDIAPVLGAHTGPGLVGMVFAPQAAFEGLP